MYIVVLLFLLASKSVPAPAAELTQVTFIPQWSPQAQFAGYYVAHEKGFYRQHGLEVKIMRGGPGRRPSELLSEGRADFGTMFLATGIAMRAKQGKLVNIAQMVQRSALMLVAKKSSGINTLQDINGKKVGLWGEEFQLQPQALFRQFRLKVQAVPQSATLNLFLRGGVDLASAMWYNEYHLILNAGVNPEELTTFFFADYGLNFPEDGIYCLSGKVADNPEICRHFVQASIEGWRYAFSHPEEALDIVMQYVNAANIAADRVHQRWMLDRMRDIILPPGPEVPMGTLRAEDYKRVAAELKITGLIDRVPDYSQFYQSCVAAHEKTQPGR